VCSSDLVSEMLETGIVRGDTHRRTAQAGSTLAWSQTENRQLITQLSYMDVSYYGRAQSLLPGYRYPAGSVGERFVFSERGNITVSAYGSMLSSDSAGNSSHEAGIQTEVVYSFSERTSLDASIGESSRRLTGVSSHGTDASVSLTHSLALGSVGLSYTRSLVPYGIGFLVERQQFSASGSRALTPYVDATMSLLRIQNNQNAVLLGIDRRSYDSASVGLNWHFTQTWTLGGQAAAVRTQPPGPNSDTANSWRAMVSMTWTPRPGIRSW